MTTQLASQSVVNSSFVIQIAGDGNTASIAVNINALDGVPASVQAAVLEKASLRLADLPCDTLPDHGTFAGRMPFTRNPQFVGRKTDLLKLAGCLKGGTNAATAITPALVLNGMGGIGKTQIAVEFVQRFGQYFLGGVFWLNFADPALIDNELAQCGYQMEFTSYDALDQPAQVRRVRQAFDNAIPRLLVFDNCEDESILKEYLPVTGGSRVLITSRRETRDSALAVQVQPIGVLSLYESVALLRKLNPQLNELHQIDLEQIARELEGLPLALHLAGSYLHHYRNTLSPADVLTELQHEKALERRLLIGAFPQSELPTKHDKSVARTFALSTSKLDADTPIGQLAWQVLTAAACLAPGEPIPDDLIKKCVLPEGVDQEAKLAVDDAIRLLSNLGLVDTQPALRMHRLVSRFVQTERVDALRVEAKYVEKVVDSEASQINEAGYPQAMIPLLLHLAYVTECAVQSQSTLAGTLLNKWGYYLQAIANIAGARDAFERALSIHETAFGLDHPKVATDANNLDRVLHDLGDFAGARDAFERALKIREVAFGPDDSNLAIYVNNLGGVLQDLGDFAGARAAYERALRIDEAMYGPDHPKVATDVNNLGGVLQDLGDFAGACAAYERALKIDEAVFGPDHPKVATCINNLGGVLRAVGDLAGAHAAYERALKIDEAVFGPDHPNVAIRVNNLGSVLQDLCDYVGARAAFERALRIDELVYGPSHPVVAVRVNNLGTVLYDLRDLAGARAAFERAVKILQKHLPPNHPNARIMQDNLNALLRQMNASPTRDA